MSEDKYTSAISANLEMFLLERFDCDFHRRCSGGVTQVDVPNSESTPPLTSQAMERENGDDYVRRTASFVRANEQRLAEVAIISRRRAQSPSHSVFGWIGFGAPKRPLIFTDDPHHLFYLLMRFDSLGIEVGSLDIHVQNPSRPTSMSYLAMLAVKDKSDVLSVSSFRSTLSSVSMFSLGGGWLGREPASVDAELKYLYSAFTKLPALCVRPSGLKVVAELADDPPTDSAIPMDAFKNLQTLECLDIDPRTLMGWDRLSEGLRSLSIKRSGLEDISDLFIDSVVDDKLRREGNPKRFARPRLLHRPPSMRSRKQSFQAAQIPVSVPEGSEQADGPPSLEPPERYLPSYAWSLLTHLSLSDNALTFLPSLPSFPSLSSLDLSSNLLISVPPSLSSLPVLKSLNLAHNMVDSVLGIYSQIPSVVSLNLSANRLDSLCGLERLEHLSRIDLRDNRVADTEEVGRLAVLTGVKEVWISGNPCTRRALDWRVRCFDLFAREGREIVLDGTSPGIMEKRAMVHHVGKNGHTHIHGGNGRPLSMTQSSVPAVSEPSKPPQALPTETPTEPQSPLPGPVAGALPASPASPRHSAALGQGPVPALKARRRNKRIVDLDDKDSTDESSRETGPRHARHRSDAGIVYRRAEQRENNPQLAIVDLPVPVEQKQSPPASSLSRTDSDLRSSVTMDGLASKGAASAGESPAIISRIRQGPGTSRTFSSAKSSKRRARLSPSMYEPASASHALPERGPEREQSNGTTTIQPAASEAELFRKRIEALRSEVGDSWLKVLSQTQFGGPDEAAIRGKS